MSLQDRIAARLREQIAQAQAQLASADALVRQIAERNLAEFTRLLERQTALAVA